MTNDELFNSLKRGPSRSEKEEFYSKLKTSSVAENLGAMGADMLANIKPMAIGGAIGGALAYLSARKRKSGTSSDQDVAGAVLRHSESDMAADPNPGYTTRTMNAIAKSLKDRADINADHPGKHSLAIGVPIGAAAGLTLAKLLMKKG